MAERVIVNEVGLRDGLQNQCRLVSTDDKLKLAESLISAGIVHMEATGFVHPKSIPQMADASELIARLPKSTALHYTALVPNMRGYERAFETGLKSIAVVVASTDTFNQKNINMSLKEATQSCTDVIARANKDNVSVRAYISGACTCPYEGTTPIPIVCDLTERMLDAGANEISIADTTGGGNPRQLTRILEELLLNYNPSIFNIHLHDTRGQALAMAWAAVSLGIRKFDSSIGGMGGCPFAPGAKGNLSTEDLVFMLEECGFETGIDMVGLDKAIKVAEQITGNSLGGRIMDWFDSQDQPEDE